MTYHVYLNHTGSRERHVNSMSTKKMQNFFRVKRAKGVVIKVCDVLVFVSWLVKPCFAYSWPEVLVCHFEMCAVGIGCALFPSTREANCFFEEEMATTFGEGQLVGTHFCQWLVSVSLHSVCASNISIKNTGQVLRTTCACQARLMPFRVELTTLWR